jgi:hypothetical protein
VSPVDPQIPPSGEEIHLPGPSVQPILLTLFITVALIGVTTSLILVIAGAIGTVWVIARWIADTRRDIARLPIHDPDGH